MSVFCNIWAKTVQPVLQTLLLNYSKVLAGCIVSL